MSTSTPAKPRRKAPPKPAKPAEPPPSLPAPSVTPEPNPYYELALSKHIYDLCWCVTALEGGLVEPVGNPRLAAMRAETRHAIGAVEALLARAVCLANGFRPGDEFEGLSARTLPTHQSMLVAIRPTWAEVDGREVRAYEPERVSVAVVWDEMTVELGDPDRRAR